MRKLLATLFCLLMSTVGAFSQDYVDLVNVYYWTSPGNQTDDFTLESVDLQNFTVNARVPVVLDSSNVLLVGAEYAQYRLTWNFGQSEQEFLMHASNLQLGWQRTWSPKFQSLFMFIPRLNSDMVNVTGDHYQYGGLALNTLRKNENFAWKLGAYYNTEFFGHFLIPLLGWDWKINDNWRFNMLLPVNADLRYQKKGTRDWAAGIRFDGANGSYRLSEDPVYFEKLENYIGLYTDVYVTKSIVINLKARYSFLRYYRPYFNEQQLDLKMGPVTFGDDRTLAAGADFNDGPTFEARLIYRFHLN